MSFAATQMDPQIILLNKVSQIQEGGGYVFLITSVVILIVGIFLWKMVEQKEQTPNSTDTPKEDASKQNDANGEE